MNVDLPELESLAQLHALDALLHVLQDGQVLLVLHIQHSGREHSV
jgi:hypothetical protein